MQYVAPLADFVEHNTFLRVLDLENAGPLDIRGSLAGAEAFLRSLLTVLPSLESLNVRRCFPQVGFPPLFSFRSRAW